MKRLSIIVALFFSLTAGAQTKDCNSLWLGDNYDSIDVFKKTAELYLKTDLKLVPNEGVKTLYDLTDADGLSQLKIWMKQKKVVTGGTVSTIYIISSFRITGVAENIDALFNALKEKVVKCTSESTDATAVFAYGKMSVEKQGGDWSKKNIPMATLTITSK